MMGSAPEERSDEESLTAIRVQIEVAPPIASEALGLRFMAPIPTEDRASNPLEALRCGLRYTFRFEKCDSGPGIARPGPSSRPKEKTDVNYPALKDGAFCSPGIFSAIVKQNNPGPPGWFTTAPRSAMFRAPLKSASPLQPHEGQENSFPFLSPIR